MKCLSVQNPWAALIRAGIKTIELRSWQTHYRGELIIVSSAKPSKSPHSERWSAWVDAPTSRAVAIVRLTDVRLATEGDQEAACCPVSPDEYAWELELVEQLTVDVHVVGRLKLFKPPYEIAAALTLREQW